MIAYHYGVRYTDAPRDRSQEERFLALVRTVARRMAAAQPTA
jgi:hypothetical protein